MSSDVELLDGLDDYRWDFQDPDTFVFRTQKGLNEEVVRQISARKNEPEWMLEFRLKALKHFEARPMPAWGPDLSDLNMDEIYFYTKPVEAEGRSWDDIPDTIKDTFDKRVASGQLDYTDFTLKDLNTIIETFTTTLSGVNHPRVEYPTFDVPTRPNTSIAYKTVESQPSPEISESETPVPETEQSI